MLLSYTNDEKDDYDDDHDDIADKLLARMEAKRVEEEKMAASEASKVTNKEVTKSKKDRYQRRKVKYHAYNDIVISFLFFLNLKFLL